MTANIEDLPPELLLKIFSHYIESERHSEFSKNVVPVCSRWWELSPTPSLWNSIDVRNWDYLMSFARRGLFYRTQRLVLSSENRILLDHNRLLVVLSNIRDLKSLKISGYFFNISAMMIVAQHCPNLERLHIEGVNGIGNHRIFATILDPILTISGPKLKYLHLDCFFANSELIISKIAAECTCLEVLSCCKIEKFPIDKIMRGCPRIKKLKLFDCKIVTTGGENNYSAFKDLTEFMASWCIFDRLDMCDLLKDANNLEHLDLRGQNFIFWDVSKIPSNKVKFLKINLVDDKLMYSDVLERAIEKWKHTLLHLEIWGRECDVTEMLRTYLNGNKCPKLEAVGVWGNSVNQKFFKTFIRKCKYLKELRFDDHDECDEYEVVYKGETITMSFKNRKDVMKWCNFL